MTTKSERKARRSEHKTAAHAAAKVSGAPIAMQHKSQESLQAPCSGEGSQPTECGCYTCNGVRLLIRAPGAMWAILDKAAVILSLAGIAYLVYDLYYQTKVSLDFAYSDPKTAIDNPIYVKNNSNLFTVTNVSWACQIQEMIFDGNIVIRNSKAIFGRIDSISPGYGINIACNNSGAGQGKLLGVQAPLLRAHIS